jgi:hypothetical protein
VSAGGRGQHVGRRLFERALGSARDAAERDGEPLQAVFAEIHYPWAVDGAVDAIDPTTRAWIMERLGARRVPITYVQPALSAESSPSGRLMLIVFPPDGETSVDAAVVAGFLREYYLACGVADLQKDPYLGRMERELEEFADGTVPLEELVGASLRFKRFGIVLHFVRQLSEPDVAETRSERLNPFQSFEEDLLSHHYRPGFGHAADDDVRFENRLLHEKERLAVEYRVRDGIPFQSEGELKTLDLPPPDPEGWRRRRLRILASRTLFPASRYVVYHLALVPAQGTAIDEYDVIVLSKLWQGGESWPAADGIRFDLDGGPQDLDVRALAAHLFAPGEDELGDGWLPRAGTVQLITDPLPGMDWPPIWSAVLVLIDEEEDDEEDALVERIDRGDPVGRQLRALGGIVQGILDFESVDAWELADVFKGPTVDSTSLVGIHKGTLLCVMESDRSYDAVAGRIGVSPYLLFPQTVLLHNEVVLDEIANIAGTVERTDRKRDDIAELSDCLKRLRRQLEWYLPNVFHYPSERALFETGERTRSLAERRQSLAARADEIDARWKLAVEKRRSLSETVRNVLLGVLSIVTTIQFTEGTFQGVVAICGSAALIVLYLQSNPAWRWWYVLHPFRRGRPQKED